MKDRPAMLDEIKKITFECQERFLESGNWIDSVKPLIEFAERETKRAETATKNYNTMLEAYIEETDIKNELIKKLRAALEEAQTDSEWSDIVTRSLGWLKTNDFILIKNPAPEIMGDE